MKEHLKNFALLTGSTLIMAVGIYFFKFANNFTFGGITGFAVLVAKFTPLSASDFSFIANMLLLIIGLFVLGKKFAAQTAYSSILLSVTLSGLERIYPMSHPLTNEPLLELIFAIVLPAIGSAILFNIGASSGGTDVIAMILKKYTSVDIGKGPHFSRLPALALQLTSALLQDLPCPPDLPRGCHHGQHQGNWSQSTRPENSPELWAKQVGTG